MQILSYQFKPSLIPSLLTLGLMVLFINLGMWQAGKADSKQAKMDLYEKRKQFAPVRINADEPDIDSILYSPVVAKGKFEPEFQVLHDNQVNQGQAGYHVITPLHLTGSDTRILVDRGWIPVGADRSVLPKIETPAGEMEVRGIASQPPKRYFELSKENILENGKIKPVLQNINLEKYAKAVNFPVHKIIILMDPADPSGGFVRDWPKPDFKIDMNRGYAMQWYFLTAALLVIYLALNLKKISKQDQTDAK